MMVWMWYDCMTSVWWCDSFVCECCECIQIEEIAKKCNKTKNRLKEPQKISLTFFCNISPNTATRGFPEDLWRPEKNVFGRDLVCLRVSLCIYWRPWRAKVLFFILLHTKKIQYYNKFFCLWIFFKKKSPQLMTHFVCRIKISECSKRQPFWWKCKKMERETKYFSSQSVSL